MGGLPESAQATAAPLPVPMPVIWANAAFCGLITLGLAALLYITLLRTFPEPVGVYGDHQPHPLLGDTAHRNVKKPMAIG